MPMQLIEFFQNLAGKDGTRVNPVKEGMPPDFPKDLRSVVTFKALGNNRTEMTVTEYGYTVDQWFGLSNAGMEQCLGKMAASVATA